MIELPNYYFKSEYYDDLRDPFKYAIPLAESYLSEYEEGRQNNDKIRRFHFMTTISVSAIFANWKVLIEKDPEEVSSYLDKVMKILKTTENKEEKSMLSNPIMFVLTKIQGVPSGEEVYGKYFQEVEELCKEDAEFTRLSRFISTGGVYPAFDEELD